MMNVGTLVLQERDRRLLRELSLMRLVDREQAKLVAGFNSTTRANLRLHRLTKAKLLRRFFIGTEAGGKRAIYSLSDNGARAVNVPYRGLWRRAADSILIADFFVQHQLAINQIYCSLKYQVIPIAGIRFNRWISFSQPLAPGLALVPDGYFELDTPSAVLACFLEVDLGSEPLRIWKEKTRNYLQLGRRGEHEHLFGQKQFQVLVVANSERRSHSIRSVVASMIEKIFWFSDFGTIERAGFWSAAWLRPQTSERHTLVHIPP